MQGAHAVRCLAAALALPGNLVHRRGMFAGVGLL